MIRNSVDPGRVRRQFSGSAGTYDEHAGVQRAVVKRLAALLARSGPPEGPVLEVGVGTGLLSERLAALWPGCRLLLSDLAHEMTRLASRRLVNLAAVDADCRALPFISGHFELVCSSSVYQWLDDLLPAFVESARVLRAGGRFGFALFGSGTLWELQESYRFAAAQNNRQARHLHAFPEESQVRKALELAGFGEIELLPQDYVEHHADVVDLLRSLKSLGAGNASPLRPRGFASRQIMQGMMERYRERFADEKGIPATYRVIFGRGTKGRGQRPEALGQR